MSQVKAKNVILASGSDAKMLLGLKPDDRILTNIEILDIAQVAQVAHRDWRGRGGRRVRLHLPQLRHRGHDPRVSAAHGSRRGRGDFEGTDAPVQEARHRREHRRKVEKVEKTETGVQGHLDRRERQAAGEGSRKGAGRRGPRAAHAECRPGEDEDRARPRLRQGERGAGDGRARRLRHRRHRGRPAATGARGRP